MEIARCARKNPTRYARDPQKKPRALRARIQKTPRATRAEEASSRVQKSVCTPLALLSSIPVPAYPPPWGPTSNGDLWLISLRFKRE